MRCWDVERDAEDQATPEAAVRLELDNDVLFRAPINIDFANVNRNRWILTLGGLVIPRPGHLRITEVIAGHDVQSMVMNLQPTPPRVQAVAAEPAPPRPERAT